MAPSIAAVSRAVNVAFDAEAIGEVRCDGDVAGGESARAFAMTAARRP
jgi:hypothetical protein